MKINPYRQVENPYQRQVQKQEQAEVKKSKDKVEISSEAKMMQQIPSYIKERELKIAELKKQVQSGQYQVDPKEVAKGMAKFFGLPHSK